MSATAFQSDGGDGDRLLVESSRRGDGVELRVAGELTIATVGGFEEQLRDIEHSLGRMLVIDLREVRFLDSTALAALVAADRRARSAGRGLKVVTAPGPVERLLSITGLDGHLDTASSPPAGGES